MMPDKVGFQDGLEQHFGGDIVPNILTVARFDSADNAARAYHDFKNKKYEFGGFGELEHLSINAECFGAAKSAGGLYEIYDVYCVKSNMYFHVLSSAQDASLNSVTIIAEAVADNI